MEMTFLRRNFIPQDYICAQGCVHLSGTGVLSLKHVANLTDDNFSEMECKLIRLPKPTDMNFSLPH